VAAATPESPGVPERLRLKSVDVLRGLSVLLVVMHHVHLRFVLNGYGVDSVLPDLLNQVLFWSGYYAVIVFFVISGFLITSLSFQRWGSPGNMHAGRFYGLRASRILPCLLLILALLSALHFAGAPGFAFKPSQPPVSRALLAALTFHVNWLEGHQGYLPGGWDPLWSLSVEEAFYLLFPLACLALRSERLLLAPLLCLVVIGPVNRSLLALQDPWGSYAYLSCADGIAFGCMAAIAINRLRMSVRILRMLLGFGAMLAIFVVLACNENSHTGLARYGLNVTFLEAGIALMLVAFAGGVGERALSTGTGWIRILGRSSYEIYLFHMPVVLGAIWLFNRLQPSASLIPAWYVSMLLASVVLGSVVFRYFSEPVNRRLRSVTT
jgi:peptidoglycan/LPS O-acetylase OafA/YrhL